MTFHLGFVDLMGKKILASMFNANLLLHNLHAKGSAADCSYNARSFKSIHFNICAEH